MARRRAAGQSSLELLLDTICNTFGGVLFIAILVVMLLQQTSPNPESTTSQPPTPLELQMLMTRLETASAELARVRKNRDSQLNLVEELAPEELRSTLVHRREVAQRQGELQSQVDDLLTESADLARQVQSLADANVKVRDELERSLAELAATESELQKDRESRTKEIRTPLVRVPPGKQEIGLVLRYGRLYVWHRYGPDNHREGLNLDDFVIIGEQSGALICRPKPNAGIALDKSEDCRAAVRRLLQRFDQRTCYFAVIVRPDSYHVFHHLRDVMLDLRHDYRLMPASVDIAIFDRGGAATHVQ